MNDHDKLEADWLRMCNKLPSTLEHKIMFCEEIKMRIIDLANNLYLWLYVDRVPNGAIKTL